MNKNVVLAIMVAIVFAVLTFAIYNAAVLSWGVGDYTCSETAVHRFTA